MQWYSYCAETCQSNCGKEGNKEEQQDKGRRATANTTSEGIVLCPKCKVEEAVASTSQESLCLSCFRSYLFGKFKLAVTSHSMISFSDKVLVAFSGGPSSRMALQFVHDMQSKSQRNLDASGDKSLPVFGVGVAFIDESVISLIPSLKVNKAIEEIEFIVSSLAPPAKELHISSIESIFSLDAEEGRSKLNGLLHTISDVTGKEDLLQHLRMLSLQKIALDNGYSKLVLGSCTSRIACHVISATVKGQGYSLPADIQYVDSRWGVPVVLPLRDCHAQELSMLCHLDSLKTQQLLKCPRFGINGLVSSFVALLQLKLQEENPSRERTIVRTAEKLTPFHFSKLPETNNLEDHLPSRWRKKLQIFKSDGSILAEALCPICSSPLNGQDLQSLKSSVGTFQSGFDIFAANCCPSCCFQILPKEPSLLESFYSLLPEPMVRRFQDTTGADESWLREQIKDCLLSDEEDGT
ncbi:adenine nucleotide alpha hydrolases-like superfamily protein isoform X2 [Tasmannia lanceolata]|uniref:adenine nucleotide alpha hydrolases-like superfamily protein isoform X2 n=1 Tax=Tasmannia lanceolata TaxID=3420 RepID=UPI004062D6A9